MFMKKKTSSWSAARERLGKTEESVSDADVEEKSLSV